MLRAPGSSVGPFEILAHLASGGMGEVYRARDRRLHREVAVKLLHAQARKDPERLARFEQEARAMGAVSHPSLLAVYDVGHEGDVPYLVTELLDGETLKARLEHGALPLRKAVEYARQIAHGLAAAHERGIVHRDLKPDNVFVTKDGRIKILDFGLARLAESEKGDDQALTQGRVLGTVGYMSPEQVRGEEVDARSDVFAFGALLYEMVTGQAAFRGKSSVETMNSILKEEPPALAVSGAGAPRSVARVILHCLEKNPEERFQSARDLAYQLEEIEEPAVGEALSPSRRSRRVPRGLGWLAAGLLAGAALHAWLAPPPPASVPSLTRLTFRRGTIEHARFASDAATVVYSAAWDGLPVEVFTCRPGSPESRPLGFPGTELLALSASGEMALSQERRRLGTFVAAGTLARAPLAGGASRAVLEDVQQADWGPDGALAVVRSVNGRTRLELPAGTVLYETAGWISHPRVSPDGGLVAFVDHPVGGDDGGNVAVVERGGALRLLSREWGSLQGLAWKNPREIWFSGTREGAARSLFAVTLDGRERPLMRMAGTLTLHDVAAGQVLVSHHVQRREMRVRAPGSDVERDFSWLDYAYPSDFDDDGGRVYFAENGEGGGRGYSVYLRQTTDPTAAAVRLGGGAALAMSHDGRRVIAAESYTSEQQRWMLLPTAAGEPLALAHGGLRASAATFASDGRLFVSGAEAGRAARVYAIDTAAAAAPRALGPEGASFPLSSRPVSPDGREIAVRLADSSHALVSLGSGEVRPVPALAPTDQVLRWCGPACLFVYAPGRIPAEVHRVNLATGAREVVWQIAPVDRAGVLAVTPVLLSADGRAYVYGYRRVLSDLYVLHGLQ